MIYMINNKKYKKLKKQYKLRNLKRTIQHESFVKYRKKKKNNIDLNNDPISIFDIFMMTAGSFFIVLPILLMIFKDYIRIEYSFHNITYKY